MGQDCKNVALDLEVGLVGAEPVEELRKTDTSQPSRGWRIYLALLAIGLCAAAAIFFSVHNLKQDISMENVDLRHTLRQLRQNHEDNNQIAINLEGQYNSSFSNNTVEWRDDQELSYFSGGLTLDRNEIVIPRKGLYFVYSQVSFRINCHENFHLVSGETHYLNHKVFRKTKKVDNTKLPLLHAGRSGCKHEPAQDSGKRWYSTLNEGAIFQLEKGDRLWTQTEPLSHVAGETGQTYFGVFAV